MESAHGVIRNHIANVSVLNIVNSIKFSYFYIMKKLYLILIALFSIVELLPLSEKKVKRLKNIRLRL